MLKFSKCIWDYTVQLSISYVSRIISPSLDLAFSYPYFDLNAFFLNDDAVSLVMNKSSLISQ